MFRTSPAWPCNQIDGILAKDTEPDCYLKLLISAVDVTLPAFSPCLWWTVSLPPPLFGNGKDRRMGRGRLNSCKGESAESNKHQLQSYLVTHLRRVKSQVKRIKTSRSNKGQWKIFPHIGQCRGIFALMLHHDYNGACHWFIYWNHILDMYKLARKSYTFLYTPWRSQCPSQGPPGASFHPEVLPLHPIRKTEMRAGWGEETISDLPLKLSSSIQSSSC